MTVRFGEMLALAAVAVAACCPATCEVFRPKKMSVAPPVVMAVAGGAASEEAKKNLPWRLDDGQLVAVPSFDAAVESDAVVSGIVLAAEGLYRETGAPVLLDAYCTFVIPAARAFGRARSGLFCGIAVNDPPAGTETVWRPFVSGGVAADGSVRVDPSLPPLLPEGSTRESWETVRRPQVLKALVDNCFGRRPVERPDNLEFTISSSEETAISGKATTFHVRGTYSGPGGAAELNFRVYLPKRATPAPVFIHVAPLVSDSAIDPRGRRAHYILPAEDIVDRGFAAISFYTHETAPDWKDHPVVPTSGVFRAFGPMNMDLRQPHEWGILSAWAWGVSRIIDWVETERRLDSGKIAVVGLSRNGKTALLTGALDTRVALTVSCCSGTGGAKLNHADLPQSEHLRDIGIARYWFAPRYWDWIDRDRDLPFDQHGLLALVAPRLLYVSSAADDAWAGPPGEFAAARLASPVWELYGKKGLVAARYPKDEETLQEGSVGYHRRKGRHTILKSDWNRYLDFAVRHGW